MAGGTQGGFDLSGIPQPGKPRRSNPWLWGLIGCGGLLVVGILCIGILFRSISGNPEFKKVISGAVSASSCSQSLVSLRASLQSYRNDHDGKYPAKLADLVPKYVRDEAALGCPATGGNLPLPIEYTRPASDAPSDAVVLSVQGGESAVLASSQQTFYVRLLKDGSIVSDQIVRRQIVAPNTSGANDASKPE